MRDTTCLRFSVHLPAYQLIHHIFPQSFSWGSSPLALAAANGHASVIRRLLFHIQQLQLPPRPEPRSSLLQTAEVVSPASLGGLSPSGEEEDAGGSGAIDSVNNFGRTPLWRAACGGHVDACRLLLRAGADPAVEDDHGTTPRDIAEDRGHDAVVTLIDVRLRMHVCVSCVLPAWRWE